MFDTVWPFLWSEFYCCYAQQHHHLQATNYITFAPLPLYYWSAQSVFLAHLRLLLSAVLFAGIALISMSRYRPQKQVDGPFFDKRNLLEILLMLLLMWVQNIAYNGLILWLQGDIFYGSKELNTKRDRKYWFLCAYTVVSFLMLLVTNTDVFFTFLPTPVLGQCISSLSVLLRIFGLFLARTLSMPQIWCLHYFLLCFT